MTEVVSLLDGAWGIRPVAEVPKVSAIPSLPPLTIRSATTAHHGQHDGNLTEEDVGTPI